MCAFGRLGVFAVFPKLRKLGALALDLEKRLGPLRRFCFGCSEPVAFALSLAAIKPQNALRIQPAKLEP